MSNTTLKLAIENIRKDFPALTQKVNGKPLIYFDNAATTLKPLSVITAITCFYRTINSNVHRGVHSLSQEATLAYENARKTVQAFINANCCKEVIITKGTTDSINMAAFAFGKKYIRRGDHIIISELEHHANIVPWQMIAKAKGARLRVIPIDKNGDIMLDEYEKLLTPKAKIVAVSHVSNVLGTVNPIKQMIDMAHAHGVRILIDGAQGIVHEEVDVQALDCDFYAFSGHKLYAPMGVGVLYGKEDLLNELPPFQTGGEMIDKVTFKKTTFNELPYKFEPGTPNVSALLGLESAIKYLKEKDFDSIKRYESGLLAYACERLRAVDGVTIYGSPKKRAGVISFGIDGVHPYDAGSILDKFGIAVRTGHHCAQPLIKKLKIKGTIRASFAFYNTFEEVDELVRGIEQARDMLRG